MKRVKITVLKTTLDRELAEEYGAEGLTACPMLREGRSFTPTTPRPEGSVMKRGRHLPVCFRLGARQRTILLRRLDPQARRGHLLLQRWLRPVIFKLETTEEEASVNYTPVR
mgnify:CR=1 FL=1